MTQAAPHGRTAPARGAAPREGSPLLPRVSALLLTSLLLLAPCSAAQQGSSGDGDEKIPGTVLSITPLLAFPDPVGISVAGARGSVLVEGGVAIFAPGVFLRAGHRRSLPLSTEYGQELLLLGGYRAVVMPFPHGGIWHGPSAVLGFRSWRRGRRVVWQVTGGPWIFRPYGFCDGFTCAEPLWYIAPEVRLSVGWIL